MTIILMNFFYSSIFNTIGRNSPLSNFILQNSEVILIAKFNIAPLIFDRNLRQTAGYNKDS